MLPAQSLPLLRSLLVSRGSLWPRTPHWPILGGDSTRPFPYLLPTYNSQEGHPGSVRASMDTVWLLAAFATQPTPWPCSRSHAGPVGPQLLPSARNALPPGLCLWAHALATCNSLLNINHPNPLSSKTAALPHLTAPASPNAPPPELMYQAHCLSLRERAASCAAKMRPRCSANMEETAPPCAPSPGLYHCLLPV